MKTLSSTAKMLVGVGIVATLAGCGGSSSDPFVFSTQTPDRFLRVDRTGQPALAAALLSKDPAIVPQTSTGTTLNPGSADRFNSFDNQRDAFNRGDPINDARDFAGILTTGPQVNSLRNIHYKIGPALRALGLTPCSTETKSPPVDQTQVDISNCVAQVAPVVVPDVLTYDFGRPAGWPNGRSFDDPVGDRLLSAALLQLSGATPPHTINTLVGVISPIGDESGVPSPATFPHLRAAHP